MLTIGARIRNKRQERGLSVDELALRLGKNRATVYRYESDDIENLPISIITPLAQALQTSPAYLMGWEDEQAGRFRQALSRYIQYIDRTDAADVSIIINELEEIAAGIKPLSFEKVCSIADELGISIDELLGREESKKAPTSDNEDGRESEAMGLFEALSDAQKIEAVNYLRYLATNKDKK